MTFTQNWFLTGGIDNFKRFLLPEFKDKAKLRFLEIGCFEGSCSLWMMENVLNKEEATLEVIDTFQGSDFYKTYGIKSENLLERYKENLENYLDRIIIHKGFSQEILREFKPKETFDFIYVDGSHKTADTLEDGVLAWRLLKKGGIMIFDDYKWQVFTDPKMNPQMGIDAFLNCFENQLQILFKDGQVVIKKI